MIIHECIKVFDKKVMSCVFLLLIKNQRFFHVSLVYILDVLSYFHNQNQ